MTTSLLGPSPAKAGAQDRADILDGSGLSSQMHSIWAPAFAGEAIMTKWRECRA